MDPIDLFMNDIWHPAATFDEFGLHETILKGLTEAGFARPTDIQAQLIPMVLTGRDVIGQAKTGTGKTAAFGLPILEKAVADQPMQALILVPTRELATQVAMELNELGKHTPIRATTMIGGESIRRQADSVKNGAQLVVGTPGRILDMHGRREIHFKNLQFAVLDEVDRMLDIGFRDDIRKILNLIKKPHQTIFVSATLSDDIERLARQFMNHDAEKIVTVSGSLTVSLVDQKYLSVQPWDKRSLLLHLLRHEDPDTTLIFCRTKITVQKLTDYLCRKGIDARQIHGDIPQNKRNSVMASMRAGKLDVLIASDLASRGLDIEHISHVINYDLPEDPHVYVHRIGRTARAGRRGIAWSFVCPDQGQLFTEIEKIAGVLIEQMAYPNFKPGPLPEDVRKERQNEQDRLARAQDAKASRDGSKEIDGLSEEELTAMFPGGVVPKSAPPRTLGGKFRTRRSR